jgi:hypothetical protein
MRHIMGHPFSLRDGHSETIISPSLGIRLAAVHAGLPPMTVRGSMVSLQAASNLEGRYWIKDNDDQEKKIKNLQNNTTMNTNAPLPNTTPSLPMAD